MGGDLAPEFILAIKGSKVYDVEVIGVDVNPNASGELFADYFYQVPMGDASNYIETILDIVKKHKINLILPGSDGEALALSIKKDSFLQEQCQIATIDSLNLQLLSDKSVQYKALQDAGVAIAKWQKAETIEELNHSVLQFFDEFEELVIKPCISRGNRGVIVLRPELKTVENYLGARELHMNLETYQTKYQKSYQEYLPAIVMQRLLEPAYDLDVLGWKGNPIIVVPRKRHNPVGIPFTGNTIINSPELIKLGEQVIKAFDLSWMYDVDVMTASDGKPYVLEVNPRYSGSCPSSIIAGIPLFDALIALAKNDNIPTMKIPQNKEVIPYTALKVKP
jgi:carbamoyl-phosphate synthase large subunit